MKERATTEARPKNSGSDGEGAVNDDGAAPADGAATFGRDYAISIVVSARNPLVLLDKDLRVEQANAAFHNMFSTAPGDVSGRLLQDVGNGQWDIPELHARLRRVLERQEMDGYRISYDFSGTVRRSLSLDARLVQSSSGNAERILLEIEDISEHVQADEGRSRLAAIVRSSDDAIVSKDLNGVITSWNGGAERLFGYSEAEVIGQPVSILIPPDREDEEPRILQLIRSGQGIDHYETVRRRKDGRLIDVSLSVSPVIDDHGHVVGAAKIARDISQQKALETSLYEASRRKNEFIAVLAHELRNPLAPIRNALRILQSKTSDDPTTGNITGMMQRQLGLIVRLVDDLLDVSRISRGKIELRRERIELSALVRDAVEAARALVQCGDREIAVECPPDPVHLFVDPTRVAQVIGNIVNNACKFTGEGGRISVIVEREGSSALVRVRDTGIGIAPEKRAMIFEMFTQIDTSLERTERGLGIGLALAKTLVELHDGEITVESEGLGLGSEFIVKLPLAGENTEASVVSRPQMPRLSGRRILIVDDNHDSATSLSVLLQMLGNETRTAHDGFSAYETALAFRPELMLLDIGLPGMNGYEVCRRIRKEPWGEAITIVALTGWGQKEDVRKSIEAGFNGHLVKPVELEALADVLAEAEPARREGR